MFVGDADKGADEDVTTVSLFASDSDDDTPRGRIDSGPSRNERGQAASAEPLKSRAGRPAVV